MFKKTPIALAVVALSTTLAFAHAEEATDLNVDFSNLPSPPAIDGNNGTRIYNGPMVMDQNNVSEVFFKNFKSINIQTTGNQEATIQLGKGNFGLGVEFSEGWQNTQEFFERVQPDMIDSVTIYSKNGSAILGKLEHEQQGNGEMYIVAKNTLIQSDSEDHAAIVLSGRATGSDTDNHFGLKILNRKAETLDDNDEEHPTNYGVLDQTITIIGKKKAIDLTNGALVEFGGGDVDITGSVSLKNGAWIDAGMRLFEKIPQVWIDHDKDVQDFMSGDKNWIENTTKLLRTIDLKATDESLPALSIEDGSGVLMAAKTLTISGVDLTADSQAKKSDKKYSTAIFIKTNDSALNFKNSDVSIPSFLSLYGKNELTINGDIVIDRNNDSSNAAVSIQSGGKLYINGNIVVKNAPNSKTQNYLNLTLKGKEQYFSGTIVDVYETIDADNLKPQTFRLRAAPMLMASYSASDTQGTQLRLRDGAYMQLVGDSDITSLNVRDSTIDIGDNTLHIRDLRSKTGGVAHFVTSGIQKGQISIERRRFNANAGTPSDGNQGDIKLLVQNATHQYSAEEIASVMEFGDGSASYSFNAKVDENSNTPGITASFSSDGNVEEYTVQNNTTVSKAINDVAGLGIMAWRAQMNDVNKRLGDLRTYQGQYGGWARVYGSETKYGDLGLKSESNTVQVGADMKIADNFYFGATASYTDGKGKLNNGTTDDRAYSFGVYGGWMGDDGQFVDVIIKEHNFKTDFDLRYTTGERSTGDFDLWGTSICAEYGWRLNVADGFWVEPQAEVTYGYMNDVTYTYSGDVKATQEATESLVARLGVAFGTTFDRGSAYVKASVAHDWMGETEISMSNGNAPMKEDLGGTWGEFAIGGTYNFANGWAVYGEFQTAKGSKMKTPYQYNIGARYVF